jgi:hypothetical protein
MRYFPELGLGYVVLLNATHSPRAYVEIQRLVFATLVRGRELPDPPAVPSPPPHPPDAGFFAFASPRHRLLGFLDCSLLGWRVEPTTGGVRLEPLIGGAIDLVPTPAGGYRHPRHSGTSLRFTHASDGTPVMVSGSLYAEAGTWWLARARVLALGLAVMLLQIAPLWAVIAFGGAAVRGRPFSTTGLVVWPAVAGLSLLALPRLFVEAAIREVLGVVHPLTIAICATTVVFALASAAGLAAALRWSVRPDRPALLARLVPSLAALSAFALTLWLGAHGIIGLRTWAW